MSESKYYDNVNLWDPQKFFKEPAHLTRFSEAINILPNHIRNLLDVGCGNGAFLKFIKENSAIEAIGVERSLVAADVGRNSFHVNIVDGDISKLPFPNGAFDIVAALEILEHLPCPTYKNGIQEIQRVARKYILVNVPFNEKRIFIDCPACNSRFPSCFHVRTFNNVSLDGLFDQFELVRRKYILPCKDYYWDRLLFFYHRIIRSGNPFPENMRCPVCDYGREDWHEVGGRKPNAIFLKLRIYDLIRFILRHLTETRFQEVVILYKRKGFNA